MIRTGLEFHPGTTDNEKRLIGRLYPPETILGSYRNAREISGTSDIVLYGSDQSPDILGGPRVAYARDVLAARFGKRASEFRMWAHSAHSVMKLPADSEAMWLVVEVNGLDLPIMCVIWAMPFKVEAN